MVGGFFVQVSDMYNSMVGGFFRRSLRMWLMLCWDGLGWDCVKAEGWAYLVLSCVQLGDRSFYGYWVAVVFHVLVRWMELFFQVAGRAHRENQASASSFCDPCISLGFPELSGHLGKPKLLHATFVIIHLLYVNTPTTVQAIHMHRFTCPLCT